MIKKWLSAYNLKYPRSIVYMLQASEYKIGAYVEWYKHLKSFHRVEVRKAFVRTSKSALLLVFAWTITFIIFIFVVSLILLHYSQINLLLGIIVLFLFAVFCLWIELIDFLINYLSRHL